MQLFDDDISCVDSPYLVVNYTSSPSNISSSITFDVENCTSIASPQTNSTDYVCYIADDDDTCWDEYEVSVAYKTIFDSGAADISDFSDARTLRMPSGSTCMNG